MVLNSETKQNCVPKLVAFNGSVEWPNGKLQESWGICFCIQNIPTSWPTLSVGIFFLIKLLNGGKCCLSESHQVYVNKLEFP